MIDGYGSRLQCRSLVIELATLTCLLALVAAFGSTAGHAEVRVDGDATALRIAASQSQVADVLAALGPTLQVRVSASVALDKRIHGSYTGSLGQVLSRVLEGYNYVVKRRGPETEIIVIGVRGDRAVAVPPPPPAPARSLAAEWRGLSAKSAPARPQ